MENELFKKIIKIVHKQNFRVLVLFQVGETCLKSPVLQFEKNALKTLIFSKVLIFAFLKPKLVK